MGGDSSKQQQPVQPTNEAPIVDAPQQALKPVSLDKQKEKETKNKQKENQQQAQQNEPKNDVDEPNPDEILNYVPKKIREQKEKTDNQEEKKPKPIEPKPLPKVELKDEVKESVVDQKVQQPAKKIKQETKPVEEPQNVPVKKEDDELINYFNKVEQIEKPAAKPVQNDLFAVDVTKFRAAQMVQEDSDESKMFKATK